MVKYVNTIEKGQVFLISFDASIFLIELQFMGALTLKRKLVLRYLRLCLFQLVRLNPSLGMRQH